MKAEIREYLLDSGRASPLRYFPKSPVKHDYVLFTDSAIGTHEASQLIVGDDVQG